MIKTGIMILKLEINEICTPIIVIPGRKSKATEKAVK